MRKPAFDTAGQKIRPARLKRATEESSTEFPIDTASGCPRDFLDNKFVYLVISPRARGMSVGVNFNPDKACNFNCVYCEVDRNHPSDDCELDLEAMAIELEATLHFINRGGLFALERYRHLPKEMMTLKHVAISGDGEPTLCPKFCEAVEAITHLRASLRVPYFKMVLITNASGLRLPGVEEGLRLFTLQDEIWAKLDVGTQEGLETINRTDESLISILGNILHLSQHRPVIIQSLFTCVAGHKLSSDEINQYARRLKELKEHGALISQVQIYSANRPSPNDHCHHLDLRELSHIAKIVRDISGLNAEVF